MKRVTKLYCRFAKANILLILMCVFIPLSQGLADTVFDEQLDRELIESLINKNMEATRTALENGANPEAILGGKLHEHAVCTAIDSRSSEYLELLIEFGVSPNAYWNVGNSDRRTPLACSVLLMNFEAFEYLLDHGADPSVDLVPEAIEKYRHWHTAFTMALSARQFTMALSLIDRYELTAGEMQGLVFILERMPFDEAHPWNYARTALIEWTAKRVPDFNPKPAYPLQEGQTQECLFSFRDLEEGLKKGTICPRPEDIQKAD